MRAVLRANNSAAPARSSPDLVLWFDAGERFELPELSEPRADTGPTDPAGLARGREPARSQRRGAPAPAVHGAPRGPAPDVTEEEPEIEDLAATEEVARSVPLRIVPSEVKSPDSLPPLQERQPARELPRADDEMSTGLFEPLQWDEADPYETGEYPSVPPLPELPPSVEHTARPKQARAAFESPRTGPAPAPPPSRPHLTVVRSADASIEEDYGYVRAEPLPPPPRPSWAAEVPLPPARPVAAIPDWYDPEAMHTLVVIDPTLRRRGLSPLVVALADAGAWAAGFLASFLAGAVTMSGAAAVLLALTLR